ncbi:cadmium-translocating P-type ATPase, partial [archaeon]|nr:cadmium-translocating P-type ATPase [archaeon]
MTMSEQCGCESGCAPSGKQEDTGYADLFRDRKFRWLLASLAAIIPLELLSLAAVIVPFWVEVPVFLAVTYAFGRTILKSGVDNLLKLNFSNINVLMVIAIAGAAYLQQFEEAAIIVILFSMGEMLEEYGIRRSQNALKKLIDQTPKTAQLKGKKEKTPVEGIEVGQVIQVKPGDQIPLDGTVVDGESLVDEAAITGEPLPKSKGVNDAVYAGTLNTHGYLEVRVGKKAQDTTLSKIIELTYRSAENKSASQKSIEKFARWYTPAVIAAAALLIIIPVWWLGQPFNPWFAQALTVLVIACPCALVISTPISVFSAIGNASRKGILVKGGRAMEQMGKIKAIAFDKTRTLTQGRPVVSHVLAFNGYAQEDVLACAAGLEAFSEHPIAKSILTKANQHGLHTHSFEKFKAVAGKGVCGDCLICTDAHHCMGSLRFVKQEHAVEEAVEKELEKLERQGNTLIVISDHKRVKGVIGVTDEIRKESLPAVESLKSMGITPVMLTGDNAASAHAVASATGIGEVRSGLLPDEKLNEISRLTKKYGGVAMVGDGINDAPALAAASVGITLGAVGSDAAIENADIALMNENLTLIPHLAALGRKCREKIKVNTVLA